MNFGAFVQKYDPLGAKLQSYDPVASAILGGGRSGPQPNVAAPKWHEVSPGRWEMEGGQQPPLATGGLRGLGASLFPGNVGPPPMQTGGGMQQMGGPMQLPEWLTGGPGQQMGGFNGMTGGGAPRSAYQMPGFDQAEPYGGGFRGNFGLGAFR